MANPLFADPDRLETPFIAEVSSNHHSDLDRCLKFVDSAADVGCAGVNFQLFRLSEVFAPEILGRSIGHRARAVWELPGSFIEPLAQRAKERDLLFGLTPFHLAGVEAAGSFVDFFKVSSYELLWDELLAACAQSGKPVVLSTGMANLKEVLHAVDVIRKDGCEDLTLLHCASSYPAAKESCNLAAIDLLRQEGAVPVGWSDNTVDPRIIDRAISAWGASVVEFHLDLDGEGGESEAGHCWLPSGIGAVIGGLKTGELHAGRWTDWDPSLADGIGVKEPSESEFGELNWRADPADGLRPRMAVRREWEKRDGGEQEGSEE